MQQQHCKVVAVATAAAAALPHGLATFMLSLMANFFYWLQSRLVAVYLLQSKMMLMIYTLTYSTYLHILGVE